MAASSKRRTPANALPTGLAEPLSTASAESLSTGSAESLSTGSALSLLDPDVRRMRIEFAAYLRAEQRGFVPGHELEDWLAAEADVDRAGRLDHLARPITDDRDYLAVKKLLELLVPAASAQADALRAEALLREVAHYELRGDGGLPAGSTDLSGSAISRHDLADYDGPRRRRSDLLPT
jgi:hypothetical protein